MKLDCNWSSLPTDEVLAHDCQCSFGNKSLHTYIQPYLTLTKDFEMQIIAPSLPSSSYLVTLKLPLSESSSSSVYMLQPWRCTLLLAQWVLESAPSPPRPCKKISGYTVNLYKFLDWDLNEGTISDLTIISPVLSPRHRGGVGGTSCRTVVVHLGAVLIVLLCSVFLFLPFFMFPHESLMCSQEHNQVSLLGIFAMMYSSGEVQRRICNTWCGVVIRLNKSKVVRRWLRDAVGWSSSFYSRFSLNSCRLMANQ